MARIRTIKPGFFRSDDVTPLSYRARLTWVGLWTYVDDDGRGKDNARIIKGEIWTLEDDVTHVEVEEDLEELHRHDRISRYEVDGKRYLVINKWLDHQVISRPTPSKLPEPAEHNMLTHAALSESSVSDPDVDTAGRGRGSGKGRGSGTGEEEQGKSAEPVRLDVKSLCSLLADLIESNGSKRPTVTTAWMDSARRLLDTDGRDLDASLRLIQWCQEDSFWRSNILSMPKFREKYDQLRLAANRQIEERQQNLQPRPTAAQRNLATVAHFEQQQMEIES